jgi:transposase
MPIRRSSARHAPRRDHHRQPLEPPGQIARDLDLTDSMVRSWVANAQTQASPTAVAQGDLEAENQELRKRIRELEMERAMLKKAAFLFAKESS